METVKHTPGLLRVEKTEFNINIYQEGNYPIAIMIGNNQKSMDFATFIIHACNSHDALVSALGQLLDRLNYHGSIDPVREEGPIEDARTALTAATKET